MQVFTIAVIPAQSSQVPVLAKNLNLTVGMTVPTMKVH